MKWKHFYCLKIWLNGSIMNIFKFLSNDWTTAAQCARWKAHHHLWDHHLKRINPRMLCKCVTSLGGLISQWKQSSPSPGRTIKKVELQTRRRRWSPALHFYWSHPPKAVKSVVTRLFPSVTYSWILLFLCASGEWNTPLIHLKDPRKLDKECNIPETKNGFG